MMSDYVLNIASLGEGISIFTGTVEPGEYLATIRTPGGDYFPLGEPGPPHPPRVTMNELQSAWLRMMDQAHSLGAAWMTAHAPEDRLVPDVGAAVYPSVSAKGEGAVREGAE